MRFHCVIVSVLLLLIGTSAVSAASISGNTASVTNPLDAAALVYVSGYEVSPAVFFPGETGTVTVHVTNAANTSLWVSQPNLIEPSIDILNDDTFSTATAIGPGETIDYHFVITADGFDGTYFPLFTVSTNVYGGRAIHSQVKIKIDSTDIRTSVSAMPDAFSIAKKDTVNISVVNPRDGEITNLLIVPETDGADIFPEESFVGTLKAGTSVQVPFSVTPDRDTDIKFHISYSNGDNDHTDEIVLPLEVGENKQGAEIVVNNIESSNVGGTITLKGDVTNNGLTDARSVLVTVESPATPVNPNPVYAIGNLEPDDFSSFEVTYTQTSPGTVPIIVEYKDTDGNVFTERFTFSRNINTAAGAADPSTFSGAPGGSMSNRRPGGFGSFGSGMNQIPVVEIAGGLIVIIALAVAWRKGLLRPLTDRFRKKPDPDDELKEQ